MQHPPTPTNWKDAVKPYCKPSTARGVWQLINTAVPFIGLWYLMYLSLDVSYALTLLLALPVAGLTVRFFIINHDCGHGSFFASRRANSIVGFWTGVLSYTPYLQWRHGHALHHARSGRIEDRGEGYFWIMGLEEYKNASSKERAWYRFYRNPFVLFLIGGVYLFLFEFRLSFRSTTRSQRLGVWATNLLLLAAVIGMGMWIGFTEFFLIQAPICFFAAILGLGLFYVQHHYEDSYWAPKSEWSYERAALEGSSFLKLDPVTEWFVGAINYHHIHHLAPRVPNYRLREAHNAVPLFNEVAPLTWRQIRESWRLRLVDEATGRWVDFPKGEPVGASTPEPAAKPAAKVAPLDELVEAAPAQPIS